MAVERTFSIIKPDATRRNLTGKINARFEEAGLRIVAQKRIWMTRTQAEAFYGVHKERPFFDGLCTFMTSGPVVVQVLEGEGAIAKNREIMGATNPANAAAGTIRKDFAESIEANSAHGSDSPENAAIEIAFFFAWAPPPAQDQLRTANAISRATVPPMPISSDSRWTPPIRPSAMLASSSTIHRIMNSTSLLKLL